MSIIPDTCIKTIDPDGSIVIESAFTRTYEYATEDGTYTVRFEPFIGAEGHVGYRCTRHDGAIQFVYLNPSSDSDGTDAPAPDLFVYGSQVFPPDDEGTVTGDPACDKPWHFYNVFEEE